MITKNDRNSRKINNLTSMQEVSKRLIKLRQRLGFKTARDFALELEVDTSYYYKVENGKIPIQKEKLLLLSARWNASIDWLLTGKGKTFINRYTDELNSMENNLWAIPVIEQKAQAGYVAGYGDLDYIENLPKMFINAPGEKGNYAIFVISGDSMNDGSDRALKEGDALLCRELPNTDWKDKLQYKKNLFIIVHAGGCVCKQITNIDTKKGILTCHSFNAIYQDFTLKLGDIYQLFYVKKLVERTVSV